MNTGQICDWVKGKHHPLGRYRRYIVCKELAYVIGTWLGDGYKSIDRHSRGYRIVLSATDYDFVEEWGRCVAAVVGREKPYKPKWSEHSSTWIVMDHNYLLYKLLTEAKEHLSIVSPILMRFPPMLVEVLSMQKDMSAQDVI